jgi:hypothetical protein
LVVTSIIFIFSRLIKARPRQCPRPRCLASEGDAAVAIIAAAGALFDTMKSTACMVKRRLQSVLSHCTWTSGDVIK